MRIIDQMQFAGEDVRTRKFLLPVSVVSTSGCVRSADELLVRKSMQIGLNEPSCAVLENKDDGENASILLDFGRELHGGIRLMAFKIQGTDNPLMQITFGESVGEAESRLGEKGAVNAHSARQFTVPVPEYSDQEWGQTGFRFVRLELLSKNTIVMLKSAMAVFVFRDYPYLGSFDSSDPVLNLIYDTAAYTCHLNLQNMVWDGIKRDRLVWIGDMMTECLTIRDVFGAIPLVEESLEFVKDQTPLPGWMNDLPSYSLWWLMIVREWYLTSGSESFLQAQKEYVLVLLDQICGLVSKDGTDRLPSYFFDWPTHGTQAEKSGVRCLLRMALESGAELAEYYKAEERTRRCRECRRSLDKQTEYADGEKQILAFMGLTGVMELSEAALRITENGTSGFSTFLLYYLLRAVAEGDSTETALSLLKEYLLGMLEKGATTFWEDFDSSWAEHSGCVTDTPSRERPDIHGDFGMFCYKGYRHSLCHGWASGAVAFLTEYVLGVRILSPGCRRLLIRPQLCGLEHVSGSFPTPYGVVEIFHRLNPAGEILSRIKAPDGVEIVCKNCKRISEDETQ